MLGNCFKSVRFIAIWSQIQMVFTEVRLWLRQVCSVNNEKVLNTTHCMIYDCFEIFSYKIYKLLDLFSFIHVIRCTNCWNEWTKCLKVFMNHYSNRRVPYVLFCQVELLDVLFWMEFTIDEMHIQTLLSFFNILDTCLATKQSYKQCIFWLKNQIIASV